ncbi:putative tyrosine decarboxylase [Delphinella strobiligena]|nr:putative tyrosine decarboxylase [Delphinella strobiligena]
MSNHNEDCNVANTTALNVLPNDNVLEKARSTICRNLPSRESNIDLSRARIDELRPGLNRASQSSRYYGFVIGGATPISKHADNIVTELDQNVQVHLPNETIATDIEDAASTMLCQLVDLNPKAWNHRTFCTGATTSNIIGLALGREYVVARAGARIGRIEATSIAALGLLKATRLAKVDEIQILTTAPHSSIRKAASVLGLGHDCVKDVGICHTQYRQLFDFGKLEAELKRDHTASIIAVSCCEVNNGLFATRGLRVFQRLRELADRYGAWIHVDAALGLLARVLQKEHSSEFARIMQGVEGIEYADSITGDAHKLLNVPYDCGIFLSRHLDVATKVFENPGAAYLSSGTPVDIPSPLNIGLENSRRFRALPVYANLIHYGRQGFQGMLIRQIRLARRVAKFIQSHEKYELLPAFFQEDCGIVKERDIDVAALNNDLAGNIDTAEQIHSTYIGACFRAKDDSLNQRLAQSIKDTKRIYMSGTSFWDGKTAVRFAVSNWQANEEEDFPCIEEVLEEAAR